MIKLIRELVRQCETKEIGYYFFDREMFAELIIQECIKVIDDRTPVYSATDLQEDYCKGNLHGYENAILELKNRFGIEG